MVDQGIKVSRLSYNKQQDIDVVYLDKLTDVQSYKVVKTSLLTWT